MELIIPRRYEYTKTADMPKDISERFEKCLETRHGIYIHGPVGCGKTHVAYALLKLAHEKKFSSMFWNVTELLRELRLDIGRKENKTHIGQKLLDFRGILFLDDIGAEKLTDWVLEEIYILTNRRYEEMIPTIFTSNLSLTELADRISERTVSRIVEMCHVVKLDGKDKRLLKKQT
jgi:DNA replication protein DnaC